LEIDLQVDKIRMKHSTVLLLSFLAKSIDANDAVEYRTSRKQQLERRVQETVAQGDLCATMIPPSELPPDDSTCWQWWDPPKDGVIKPGMPTPPKGCDYKPCQDAVCACDSYCCETAWDLSCRGYDLAQGDGTENNYFVNGCSAKLLCCEPESAFPDPPVGGALPMPPIEPDDNSCTPGSEGCCDTMIPPSYFPPDDSTCWQWWDPPADGVMKPGMPEPPKGCNYTPCQDAVCACDSYCCETAWDLSCRGYHLHEGDMEDNNYFVDGCSAKILCCEPESAFPDPPVGGAVGIEQVATATATSTGTETGTASGSATLTLTGTSSGTGSVSVSEAPSISFAPTGVNATHSPTSSGKGKGKGGSKKGSKGAKGSKKSKGKGKGGSKKGPKGTKGPKSAKKGSKSSKSKKSSTSLPTITPVMNVTSAPTLSPTATSTVTSTSTSTSTGTFSGTSTLTGTGTIFVSGTTTLTST